MLIGAGIGIPFQQNVLARLLGSAEFFAPLTHSAIPTRAAFGTTGTFTRATTSTWPNNDGYMVTGVAGEIGFVGARRVRNLVANKSEDNTVGSSLNSNATTTQTTVSLNTINNSFWYKDGVTLTVGNTYVGSLEISTAVPATVTVLIGGTAGGNTALSVAATTTPTRVEVAFTATIAGTVVLGINNTGGVNTQTGTYTITDIQIEDVTAQTTQTAGEYVSVGVESAPYYHGSMVDGVKCFPNDLSGNPIPSTTLLGYQAEGARENLQSYSNDFTNAVWNNEGARTVITANAGTSPSGANDAWSLIPTADNNAHRVYNPAIVNPSGTFTISLFAKTIGGYNLTLSDTGGLWQADFDLTNGTVATPTSGESLVARIEAFPDGWYRCSATVTSASGNFPLQWTTDANKTLSYVGNTTSGVYWYGYQLELGSFASSYIATTTIAVARNADVLTYPSAGNIDGTVGWCYAEVAIPTLSGQTQLIAGASVNSAAMYISSDTKVSIYDNTAERKGAAFTASSSVGKLVTTWGGSESKTAFNGTASAALGFDGDLNYSGNLQIGAYAGASAALPMFGTIRNVRIGQRQLSASELQAITA